MLLVLVSDGFQSLPWLPTINLGPSGADSRVGGFVYILQNVGLSSELSYEAGSFSCCVLYSYRSFQSEVLMPPPPPPAAGTLCCCAVCLTSQLFLPVYLHVNVGPSGPPAAALPRVLSACLPISVPPTGLGECFFFNSLVVGLPYSSIFC